MRISRWAVSAFFFTNGFLYAAYVSRIPDIQEHFSLDYRGIGIILLSGAVGSLLAMPFTGALIARWQSKRVTTLAAFGFCFSVSLFMFSPGVVELGCLFFLKGVLVGITDVAMNAQAVIVERTYNRPIMSTFHGVFSLGMFAGAGLGGYVIHLNVNVAGHLLLASGISLLAILFFSRYLVATASKVQDRRADIKIFNLPHPLLIGLGAIAFCGMLAEGAMADWSTNYLKEVLEAVPSTAPAGLVGFSLAMVGGRFLGDYGRMRFGDGPIILYCSLLSAIGTAIIISSIHIVTVVLGFFIVGLGLSIIVPVVYSRAGNTRGIDPGLGISMVTTIGYAGFMIGPPTIGYLADWIGLRGAFGFVLSLLILMFALSLWEGRKEGRATL